MSMTDTRSPARMCALRALDRLFAQLQADYLKRHPANANTVVRTGDTPISSNADPAGRGVGPPIRGTTSGRMAGR